MTMRTLHVLCLLILSFSLGLAQGGFQPLEPLGVTRFFGHAQSVAAAALSPDGSRLVSIDETGQFIVWNAVSGEGLRSWSESGPRFNAVKFLPDGREVITGREDGHVDTWDLEAGKTVRSWPTDQPVRDLIVSPDGKTLALCCSQLRNAPNMVSLRNIEMGERLRIPDFEANISWDAPFERTLGFSPDSQTVFVTLNGSLRATRISDGTTIWSLEPKAPSIDPDTPRPRPEASFALSPDGSRLAVGSSDGLHVLDANTGKIELEINSDWSVGALRWSPDGTLLASSPRFESNLGNGESITTIWDATTGKRKTVVDGDDTLDFGSGSDPNKREITTRWGSSVMRWNLETGRESKGFDSENSWNSKSITTSGQILNLNGSVLALTDFRTEKTLEFGGDTMLDLTFSPDGRTVATAGADGTIRIFDAASAQDLGNPITASGYTFSLAFSPDGSKLAATSGNEVYVLDATTGRKLQTLNGEDADRDRKVRQDYRRQISDPGLRGFARCLAWSPDGKILAVGYQARGIALWDVAGATVTKRLFGHTNWVLSLAWRPDGKQLASTAGDATVRFWDVNRGISVSAPLLGAKFVRAVAYSPNGRALASAAGDGIVTVWDAINAKPSKQLRGHTAAATSLAWSPDGAQLVSGSSDRTLRVWDVSNGQTLQTITGPEGVVLGVGITRDGSRLLAVSRDNTLRVWGHKDGSDAFGAKK